MSASSILKPKSNKELSKHLKINCLSNLNKLLRKSASIGFEIGVTKVLRINDICIGSRITKQSVIISVNSAITHGYVSILKIMLDNKKLNIDLTQYVYNNILVDVCLHNNIKSAIFLFNNGVKIKDNNPLSYAIVYKYDELIHILLQNGAVINYKILVAIAKHANEKSFKIILEYVKNDKCIIQLYNKYSEMKQNLIKSKTIGEFRHILSNYNQR